MTLTIQREPLTHALERCSKVANPKSTAPILAHMLLEASGGTMSYRATDLQIGVTGSCSAAGKLAALCVQPKDVLTAVASLPGDNISMVVKGERLEVSGDGKRKFKVKFISGDDFPQLAAPPDKMLALPDAFRDHLERVRHALDETMIADRPHLASILADGKGGSLTFHATDGRRLSMFSVPSELELSLQIPSAAVKVLLASDGPISAAQTERTMFFRLGPEVISATRMNAPFPPVDYFLNLELPNKWRVDAAALLESARAVGGVAGVRISLAETGCSLLSEDGEASDELDSEATAFQDICVTARYLVEALKGLTGPITIEYNGELDPLRIKVDGFHEIVMPLRMAAK